MNIIIERKTVDYSKLGYGSIIVFDNTTWTVLESESGEYAIASLKSNEILRKFNSTNEMVDYIKTFKDILEIFSQNEFTLKIVKG